MDMLERVAESVNCLGDFCGLRDVPELTRAALEARWNGARADVMVLFGGSVLAGGDLLARAMQEGVAEHYVIVGGVGHTTDTLRAAVRAEYPEMDTRNQPEAELFQAYLDRRYGLRAEYLETRSTNCGNNITNLLALIAKNGLPMRRVVLCQDASMQRRMDAGFRKYAPPNVDVVNFAAYCARVVVCGGALAFERHIHGMWNMARYLNLLMGEIPRLTDDENGYGPRGRGFIAHVDVPDEVQAAFEFLKDAYGVQAREANPLYAGE